MRWGTSRQAARSATIARPIYCKGLTLLAPLWVATMAAKQGAQTGAPGCWWRCPSWTTCSRTAATTKIKRMVSGVEYLDKGATTPRPWRVIDVLRLQESFAEDESRAGGVARLNRMPAWLATHPANAERLLHATYAAGLHPAKPNADAGRDRYLRAIDGLVFGDSRGTA